MLAEIWMALAAVVALGIDLDLGRLRASRVGLSRVGWVVAALLVGPLVIALYLPQRHKARAALVAAAWALVGDASQPASVRLGRLTALRQSQLIGDPIYRACLRVLDAEQGHPGAVN